MARSLTACFAGVLLASQTAGAVPLSFAIAPGNFDEHCVKLEAGTEAKYRFDASAPVRFNIHHHRGKDVLYPVKREHIRKLEGRFRARAADDYCLMWENKGKQAVTVRGTVEP